MQTRKKTQKEKVKFAVVGLGHIAQTAVLPAFKHAKEDAELTALVSGDDEKLRELGKKYKVPGLYSYDDYDRLLDSGEVHAVYIALPNRMHADYSVRALTKGVHVLCEKPLAVSEEECRRMVDAAKESGAKLMTAYRLHFEEANLKAIRLARDRLGKLRYFNSSFSYNLRDPDNIRLQEEEGGPLWDVGIYCINAARYLFQAEPSEVTALSAAGDDPRFQEVPETVAVTMKFPGERLASFTCSFGAAGVSHYEVVGAKGRLVLDQAYEITEPKTMKLELAGKTERQRFKKSDQFAPELIYFAECIRKNRVPEASGYEGWADVRIMLAIEESLRGGKRISLGKAPQVLATKERPDLTQWIQKPPVQEEPKTVNVESPTGEEAA